MYGGVSKLARLSRIWVTLAYYLVLLEMLLFFLLYRGVGEGLAPRSLHLALSRRD